MKNTSVIFLSLALLFFACKTPKQSAKSNQPGGGKSAEGRIRQGGLSQTQQADVMYIFFNANKEKMLGNLNNAKDLFSQVLRQDMNNSAAMYNLADIYDEQKDYTDALYFAKKAYTLDSKNEWYARLLVEVYEKNNKYSDAVAVYQKLIKDFPDRGDFYFGLAEEYIYDNKLQEAIKVYDQIEAKIGVSPEVSLQKERLYVKLGKNDKAIAEVQKLVDTDPDNAQYLSSLAALYQAVGQDEKAMALYNKILSMHPDDPYVHLSLADYYRNKGEKEKSFDEIKKAFENKDLETETKIEILSSYYKLVGLSDEMKNQAFELAKLLIESSPNEGRAYAIYGDFLSQDKKYEEARKEYREAIRFGTKEFAVYVQILYMDSQLNDTIASLRDSEDALAKFPEQPRAYYFNGITRVESKKYDEGIATLNSGLKLVVDDKELQGEFYGALGDAYNSLKDYTKSDDNFQKALDLNPKDKYLLNNWSYYLSLRGEQLDKAEEMSKQSMELEPNSGTFEDITYAWVVYKMGRFTVAKEYLEKAFTHGADKSATSLEHYGDVMFKLGDPDKALEYWLKAKQVGGGSDLLDKKIADKKLYEANGVK